MFEVPITDHEGKRHVRVFDGGRRVDPTPGAITYVEFPRGPLATAMARLDDAIESVPGIFWAILLTASLLAGAWAIARP